MKTFVGRVTSQWRTAALLLVIFTLLALVLPRTTLAQTPVGAEFQVNSYTTSNQRFPSVAVDQDGAFVVVWQSVGSDAGDTSSQSVQGQRFDSLGNSIGTQFQVNSYTTVNQRYPSVAVAQDGAFVVVWQSFGSDAGDTSNESVQGQRFDSLGNSIGTQFQVNSYTTNSQSRPSVAVDQDGAFVVVWQSLGSAAGDTSSYGVQGQRFDWQGNSIGTQFQVNSYTTNSQSRPSVAVAQDGDFVVVWQSLGSAAGDVSSQSVQGQRFDWQGNSIGTQFQVNSYTTNSQSRPSVAVAQDGDFVVVWESLGSAAGDTSSYGVQGQRFDWQGNSIGTQFQVNSYTTSSQSGPSVAVDQDGDFVVVWNSYGSAAGDTSSYGVQGQRFDWQGNSIGTQFQVNSYTTSSQSGPSVAVAQDGDFVVVWQSYGSDAGDTSDTSVQGQRYRVTGDIGDLVWEDHNFDGLQDLSEPGLESVRVNLYDDASTFLRWTETDVQGEYAFKAKPGRYYLEFELPNTHSFTRQDIGLDDTVDSDADLSFGQTIGFPVVQVNAHFEWDAGMANGVGNFAWHDLDQNGFQDGNEPGLAGVSVSLIDGETDTVVGTPFVTAAEGKFHFNNITPGDYYLSFTPPPGFAYAPANAGADDERDSDANAVTGFTPIFAFSPGTVDISWDAGFVTEASTLATIGDRVWLDDGDGIQAGGEPGVDGVTVNLFDSGKTMVDSTSTASGGFYSFTETAGDYYLEVVLPADMAFAPADQGVTDAADSDILQSTGTTIIFSVATGQTDDSWDAGMEPAVIGNRVWLDINEDGRQQPAEQGVAGVTVNLLNDANTVIDSTITGVDGIYQFSAIPTGDYSIEVVLPPDTTFSSQDVGSNDLIDSDVDPANGRTALFSYSAASASRSHDAGLIFRSFFADGFETGDTGQWSSSVP